MFTLASKAKVYLIIGALVALIIGAAYWYYTSTQEQLRIYAENSAKLEIALQQQQAATEALENDIAVMGQVLTKLNKEFADSRKVVADLEELLNEDSEGNARDIGKNAVEDAQGVEDAVNKGTDEVFACIKSLSDGTNVDGQEYINCPDNVRSRGLQ